MTLTLSQVLAHPSLTVADPAVLAGSSNLERRVRWIHSSEVLDIATLLRGGELLLTGGQVLGTASESEQRRYIRGLSERRVAGVAIETGPDLPAVPGVVLDEARAYEFPVIELRRVVPFVGVTEAVNAELVNNSVARFRYGGELAHSLAAILSRGGGVQSLLEELAHRTTSSVALFDSAGELITEAHPDEEAPAVSPLNGMTSRITIRGAHAATLMFYPSQDSDVDLLAVAGDRAGEAITLALLRTNPPSPRDFAASELARLTARAPDQRHRILHLGEVVGLRVDDPVVAVAIHGPAGSPALPGLDGVLRRYGRVALDMGEAEVLGVVSLTDRSNAAVVRNALISGLTAWARDVDELVVAIGPVVPGLSAAPESMSPALSCLEHRVAYGGSVVVDAAATMVLDWLRSEALRPKAEQIAYSQLAMLNALRRREADVLMSTLEAYFDAGCNKTRTAEALHLQRQSLYGRLERAFAMLGGDPTGTERALALHLALKLRHIPRGLAGLPGESPIHGRRMPDI
ncbi:PucR family transcriptional regulator [Amycolatopsis palatopharyngis]|uniref:PucR family transcriptional regulator n=1 Tax=Amycolatopsis palatopharyngis TaxID=187982 RepID=UPI000E25E8B7|nr:PucR family transcriptional regulator [Amycolatopsis palatopharyngis]